jgi:predicted small lipoprotein YifL
VSSSRGPKPGKRLRRAVAAAAAAVTLAGCAQPLAYPPSAPPTGKRAPPTEAEFKAGDLLKSDVDAAAELHLKESLASARLLMEKLYRRNPRELRKSGYASLEPAVERAFDPRYGFRFPELKGARGTAAIQLALKPEYEGDRVFAFSVGLAGMILQAYGDKTEVYLIDSLDPQKLYNAARNVEIAAWKLANARDAQGRLLILSNDMAGEAPNLSFEREIGKLIAYQDVMAQVAAQRTNRTIRRSVQFIATAVFLPI